MTMNWFEKLAFDAAATDPWKERRAARIAAAEKHRADLAEEDAALEAAEELSRDRADREARHEAKAERRRERHDERRCERASARVRELASAWLGLPPGAGLEAAALELVKAADEYVDACDACVAPWRRVSTPAAQVREVLRYFGI